MPLDLEVSFLDKFFHPDPIQHRMSIALPNGARIIGLAGRDDPTRGFSAVSLLLVDEASRVAEDSTNKQPKSYAESNPPVNADAAAPTGALQSRTRVTLRLSPSELNSTWRSNTLL